MTFHKGQRIYHVSDPRCTGIVLDVSTRMVWVQWDVEINVLTNPSWWYFDEVRPVQYFTPESTIQKKEEPTMSQAVWCDKGGHAFSAKDPDREHYTSTKQVKDGNLVQQVTAELDICGACMRDTSFSEVPAITGTVVQDKVPAEG